MRNKKSFIYIVLGIKYFVLFNFTPDLEVSRYQEFFSQCINFETCLNPYKNISTLSQSFLNFLYCNLIYFVILPFFFIGSLSGLSFITFADLFFEILLIYIFDKIFKLSPNEIIIGIILNPVIVFSIGVLGQLDLIPLTFFALSLLKLKENKKILSIIFLIIATSTKIVFIILLPIIILYFLKRDKNMIQNIQTVSFTLIIFLLINIQLFLDSSYRKAIFFGLDRGYSVVTNTNSLFSSSLFLIILFSTITLFAYWKNIHRLDFFGITIFSGFLTLPIYVTNLSNIGWFLWSMPTILIIYLSFEYKVKSLILTYLFLLVLTNDENSLFQNIEFVKNILTYFVYSISILIFYYLLQALTQNIYFKIKSSPIIFAIAGDSATGKTTVSNALKDYFGKKIVNIVELDSFHKYERNSEMWYKYTHLNPKMNNLSELRKVLLNIINRKTEIVRQYNHLTGKFDNFDKKKIKDFLIVEGLHSLHFKDLNSKYNMKVFLDIEPGLKKTLKISRDIERQKSEEFIENEIEKRKKDINQYILPQEEYSDLSIKTIAADDNEVNYKIVLSEDYFSDIDDIGQNQMGVKIKNIKINENVSFEISVLKKESKSFFESLTKGIKNLEDFEFNPLNQSLQSNGEVLIKLGLILFILNKKLETKI